MRGGRWTRLRISLRRTACLGRLLANAGEVEQGIQGLEIARQQAPDSPQVHFSLAAAYAMAGRKKPMRHGARGVRPAETVGR